jgi:long-chain acyl-CoA synthetase
MLGDRRPFPIMLVVPNLETLSAWATQEGLPTGEVERLLQLPKVRSKMEAEVQTTLRDLARFEQPKKVVLLPHDFTVEAGELTPTLKVKRRVVEERHRAVVEALYSVNSEQ